MKTLDTLMHYFMIIGLVAIAIVAIKSSIDTDINLAILRARY